MPLPDSQRAASLPRFPQAPLRITLVQAFVTVGKQSLCPPAPWRPRAGLHPFTSGLQH